MSKSRETRDTSDASQSGVYLLLTVSAVSMHQYVGQYLFSVALSPIKSEFHLSDSELGAINGPAFLLFFGVFGIPIARFAERVGQRRIIAGSIAAWSLFTAATALCSGALGLFLARAITGISQSGCNPAIQSLIAARFPPHQRSGAMAVMYASLFLGVLFGLATGSLLVQALGWRRAFISVGLIGMLFAPVVWLTLRDPPLPAPSSSNGLVRDLREVIGSRSVVHYLIMSAIMGLTTTGTIMWAPAFYSRHYGMDVAEAGTAVGFILGGGSLAGSLLGGAVVNRLNRTRDHAGSSFMMWSTFASVPAAICAFIVNDCWASLTLLLLWTFTGCLPAGRVMAMLHHLVEPRHRSVSAALALLAASLGGAIGPFLVGVVSDLAGSAGHDALRTGLLSISVLNVWALAHMYLLNRADFTQQSVSTSAL